MVTFDRWTDRLKRLPAVSISGFVEVHIPTPSTVVPKGYPEQLLNRRDFQQPLSNLIARLVIILVGRQPPATSSKVSLLLHRKCRSFHAIFLFHQCNHFSAGVRRPLVQTYAVLDYHSSRTP